MYWYILAIVCIIFIIVSCVTNQKQQMYGGDISQLVSPVDMLQMPKKLLMDGYRFQNTLFPPIEYNQSTNIPMEHQRVGIFKNDAYVDQQNGGDGASQATIAQIKGRGDQDKYLTGNIGVPIEETTPQFSQWIGYTIPERHKEVNYPNTPFSWGDIIHRYHTKFPEICI